VFVESCVRALIFVFVSVVLQCVCARYSEEEEDAQVALVEVLMDLTISTLTSSSTS